MCFPFFFFFYLPDGREQSDSRPTRKLFKRFAVSPLRGDAPSLKKDKCASFLLPLLRSLSFSFSDGTYFQVFFLPLLPDVGASWCLCFTQNPRSALNGVHAAIGSTLSSAFIISSPSSCDFLPPGHRSQFLRTLHHPRPPRAPSHLAAPPSTSF